ncbi:MAG: protein kinase domain-containing protein [Flammeovirgaceae bacterium]
MLDKRKIVEDHDIHRLTREIEILKKVRHKYIIQLFEIIETPKQLYLIMEYV